MWKFINGSVFVLFIWTLLVANIELVDTNVIPPPAQPCDRTRLVFTDAYGEISDGPIGFNYTQVTYLNITFHCKTEYVIAPFNTSELKKKTISILFVCECIQSLHTGFQFSINQIDGESSYYNTVVDKS